MEKTAYEEYVVGKDANQTADGDSVKCYLADMGNIELLSSWDENRLSERILRGQCVLALKIGDSEVIDGAIKKRALQFYWKKPICFCAALQICL